MSSIGGAALSGFRVGWANGRRKMPALVFDQRRTSRIVGVDRVAKSEWFAGFHRLTLSLLSGGSAAFRRSEPGFFKQYRSPGNPFVFQLVPLPPDESILHSLNSLNSLNSSPTSASLAQCQGRRNTLLSPVRYEDQAEAGF
jgi:hypothetical protein